jgi:hypothetical protein
MFSWSNNNNDGGRRSRAYPGHRASSAAAAQPIEGSIRPPDSQYSRAQHLSSYLEDPTLSRSTRRVSSGTCVVYNVHVFVVRQTQNQKLNSFLLSLPYFYYLH